MSTNIIARRKRENYNGIRTKGGALRFERFAATGNRFVNEVANELGVPRNSAARITRAVLHAMRDRLPPNDAVEFAQGLPMALKAVFIDQYDLSAVPVVIRHPHDFLDYIFYKNEFGANVDFPEQDSVENALVGVVKVLERYMDPGQINQILRLMGNSIADMVVGAVSYSTTKEPLRIRRVR